MRKFDNPIEVLTQRIQNHIDNGGNIYQPKRQLPYYDYLHALKQRFSKRDGVKYEIQDIYKMCGFDFDPEYAEHLEIMADLQDLADKNNYVDKLSNFKQAKPETYGRLCTLATKHGTCLYDFLVLTTGFRLKEAHIDIDYEKALVARLKKAYPDRNLTGIRRENTDLYEMLRHLKRYKYPTLSMAEVIDILGFTNSRMLTDNYFNVDEASLLKQLEFMYPDKLINQSLCTNKDFYYRLIKLSVINKISLIEYLNKNGYTYLQGNMVARLAQMKVDENERYNFLMNKKKEFYSKHNIEKLTNKQKYYLDLQLVDEVAKLDNLEQFANSDLSCDDCITETN